MKRSLFALSLMVALSFPINAIAKPPVTSTAVTSGDIRTSILSAMDGTYKGLLVWRDFEYSSISLPDMLTAIKPVTGKVAKVVKSGGPLDCDDSAILYLGEIIKLTTKLKLPFSLSVGIIYGVLDGYGHAMLWFVDSDGHLWLIETYSGMVSDWDTMKEHFIPSFIFG